MASSVDDTQAASEVAPATAPANRAGGFQEYSTSILVAVGLALLIRSTIVQAFYIPSGSMEDTLYIGDYLLANKFVYGAPIEVPLVDAPLMRLPALRDPQPGDIVIFRSLEEVGRDLIKRCVAVGGQTVQIRDKKLYVDGVAIDDAPDGKYVDPVIYPARSRVRDNYGPLTIPEGHFFMMGDNRDRSRDSRYFGPVPREKIKGKAMIIYWSSTLVSGPLHRLPQMLADAGNFAWNLPSLPFRTRYSRLGTVIH
jgi:signal peptidase I